MTENATPAAPLTSCTVCRQQLTPWTNHNGVVLLVADDGWGTICGDAPRGMHEPAMTEPSTARGYDIIASARINAGMCPDPGCPNPPVVLMHRSTYAPSSGVLPVVFRVCAPHVEEIEAAEDAAAARAEMAATSGDYLS